MDVPVLIGAYNPVWKANPREARCRLTPDLFTETQLVRKGWQDIFRVVNEKNTEPRILYAARLSNSEWKER